MAGLRRLLHRRRPGHARLTAAPVPGSPEGEPANRAFEAADAPGGSWKQKLRGRKILDRGRAHLGDCDSQPLPDVAAIPTTAFLESARPSRHSPRRPELQFDPDARNLAIALARVVGLTVPDRRALAFATRGVRRTASRFRVSSRGEARSGELPVVCSRLPVMPSTQLVDHGAAATAQPTRLLQPWRTRSLTLDQSSSATTLGSFAPSGLRIVWAIQSSHRARRDC